MRLQHVLPVDSRLKRLDIGSHPQVLEKRGVAHPVESQVFLCLKEGGREGGKEGGRRVYM
jgi:hypothetical protein